jgi:hypothetical protein
MSWWKKRFKEKGDVRELYRSKVDEPLEVVRGIPAISRQVAGKVQGLLHTGTQQGRSVSVIVPPGTTGFGEEVTVLNLTGDDRDARSITIHTSLDNQRLTFGGASPSFRPSIQGRVQWGAAGVQSEALFDWMQGTTFNVAASWLRVSARALPSVGIGTPVETNVGVSAGYGVMPSSAINLPQLTQYLVFDADPVLNYQGEVPPFAHSVVVYPPNDAPAAPYRVVIDEPSQLGFREFYTQLYPDAGIANNLFPAYRS